MFSTVEKVENHIENVENYRKTVVFSWKTIGIRVGKSGNVENLYRTIRQIVLK